MEPARIDQKRKDAFGARMLDVFNHGMLTLMMSIGHQTNLFNVMAQMPPATSEQIAAQARLQERYVREWLGAMVTGKFVDYDSAQETYHLPPEHAAYLTQAAGPDNMARLSQYIPMLALVEQEILECFRDGGGLPYERFPRLQTIMGEGAKLNLDGSLIEDILPLSDLVDQLERGIRVLEIGCGQGHAVNLMGQAYPNSEFSGYDIDADALAVARQEAAQMGLSNVTFAVRDIASGLGPGHYDLIAAFDVIHDQAQPQKVLQYTYDALKSDGTFFMMDFQASSDLGQNIDHPAGPFMYTISTLHCMTVSLAQGGPGLGTVWGEEKAVEMLGQAGFTTEVKHLPDDFLNTYFIARKT